MKRLALLPLFALAAFSAAAQTMSIHSGTATIVFAAADVPTVSVSQAEDIVIGGEEFPINEIDSITFDREGVLPTCLTVTYDDEAGAHLTMPFSYGKLLVVEETDGNHVTVTTNDDLAEELSYVLQGSSTRGSFTLNSAYKATVTLNGVNLESNSGPAIDIEDGKRIKVVVADGTTNTLSDAANGTHKACFFVKGHPEFSGTGTISLNGYTKHAFASDEYTELKECTLKVLSAEGDGMHIAQYLKVKSGEINITGTKGDGIDVSVTKDATDEDNGQINIKGGSITIAAATDDTKGMKCDSTMTITGGTINITASGNGTKGISTGTDLFIGQTSADVPTYIGILASGTTYMPGDETLESKCRGIKVKGNFTFDGGQIAISATGKKSKAISVDGTYTYKSGTINCSVDASNT